MAQSTQVFNLTNLKPKRLFNYLWNSTTTQQKRFETDIQMRNKFE